MKGAATLALLLAGLALCEAGALDLDILHINDHHSHIEDAGFTMDTSGILTDIPKVDIKYGGFPRIVTLMDDMVTANPNTLKLHAGDAITGTLWYSIFKGVADAAVMGKACFDAFALGNHEFDDGDSVLADFLTELATQSAACPGGATKVLAANVVPATNSRLRTENLIMGHHVFTVGGEQVGVVGIDIAQKTMDSSSPSPGTILTDEVTAAQAEIDILKAAGVDKIILLTHVGYWKDMSFAEKLRGVDAMVGGDTHTLLGDTAKLSVVPGAMPEGVFPTMVTNLDGKKVCVVQAWHYAHAVGKLSISFDANGDVTSCGGGPQFPLADSSSFVTTPPRGQTGNPLSAEDQALVVAKLLENNAMVTEEHVATKAWIDTNKGEISSMQNEVIATFDQAYCLARFPQFQSSTICTGCESYVHGGPACALVAKGFLMIEKTADIAIQNGGGCRSDLAMGDFSIGDAYTMLPFANTMLTLKMTGAQIKMVLEEALSQPLDRGGSSGSYPYASGLRYNVDASKPFPHRVSNVEVNSRLQGQWSPIDLEHEYTVVTNNYIAGGKDGYVTFGTIPDEKRLDTFTNYAQSFIDYLGTVEGAIGDFSVEEMSTQDFTSTKGCQHSITRTCGGSADNQLVCEIPAPHPPSKMAFAEDYGRGTGFYHGVASGDPLHDSVIIWTRYTPAHASADSDIEIEYRMAEVPAGDLSTEFMAKILDPVLSGDKVMLGKKMTSARDDFTVKLDITGLKDGTQYVFAFVGPQGEASPVGMTKTSPAGDVEDLHYAVFSCSNWGFGYFHAYNVASIMAKLDFWIHLGDYIYEYGDGNYPYMNARTDLAWGLKPGWEIVDLQDYRLRYAMYNTDEALQNLRARAPMIAIWDDHELTNDAHSTGAENHQEACGEGVSGCSEDEGIYAARVGNAAKAYLEWMPIRNQRFYDNTGVIDGVDITQVVEWGNLATIAGFDTRVKDRTASAPKGGGIFDSTSEVMVFAATNTDTATYAASTELQTIGEAMNAERSQQYTDDTETQYHAQLGKTYRDHMKELFAKSKAAGKPWQIFATQTVFGKQAPPNFALLPEVLPGSEAIVAVVFALFGVTARMMMAAAIAGIPWNTDSWDGYQFERTQICEIFKEHTNNAVVLSGDSHDAWAFTLTSTGDGETGDEVGVNLGTPGVASPGWLAYLPPLQSMGMDGGFAPPVDDDGSWAPLGAAGFEANNKLWVASNPGLKYANVKDKGFIAVKVTKTEHISEFISITDDLDSTTPSMDGVQKKDYKTYGLTAPFQCSKALKTTAGAPGSLESVECSIEFLAKRPMELSAHVASRPGWMQIAWGQEQYKNCAQPWTWEQLTEDYVKGIRRFKMGGLGKLMGKDGYESWVCLKDHPCSTTEGDYFCWAYHETNDTFTPWGENSVLHMVDVTEDRVVLGEFCKTV